MSGVESIKEILKPRALLSIVKRNRQKCKAAKRLDI